MHCVVSPRLPKGRVKFEKKNIERRKWFAILLVPLLKSILPFVFSHQKSQDLVPPHLQKTVDVKWIKGHPTNNS